MMIRKVANGEVVSGHGCDTDGNYPSINVLDREKGSLMFSIECFHWATVERKGAKTALVFENKVTLATDGFVEYCDPHVQAPRTD